MKLAKRRSNPAPTSTGGNLAFAIGALAVGAGAGAVLAAAPMTGVVVTGGAGLVTAAVSPRWREAGLTTAGLSLGLLLATGIVGAINSRKAPPAQGGAQ